MKNEDSKEVKKYYKSGFPKLNFTAEGRVAKESYEDFDETSTVKMDDGSKAIKLYDIVLRSFNISDKYRFKESRKKLSDARMPNEDVKGRFDSLEERLNCIEDEIEATRLYCRNDIEEGIEALDKQVSDNMDNMNENHYNALDHEIEELRKEFINEGYKDVQRIVIGCLAGSILTVILSRIF